MHQNKARIYFTASAMGIVLYLVLDVVALPPHYSPVSQSESDLAVRPYAYIMAVNFLIRGLLSWSFITELVITLGARRSQYRIGLILLGLWAIGAMILAFFPTDLTPTPPTTQGIIHSITALVAFFVGGFGVLALSLRLRSNEQFKGMIRRCIVSHIQHCIVGGASSPCTAWKHLWIDRENLLRFCVALNFNCFHLSP